MIWKTIPGCAPYEVSSIGQVRRGSRILKTHFTHDGYERFSVSINNVRSMLCVHVAVARAFIGPRPKDLTINHEDGNKRNNAWTNLAYMTNKKNHEHAARLGLRSRGEDRPASKLTIEDVRAIKLQIMTSLHRGDLSRIARKYKVSPVAIGHIKNGTNWAWVKVSSIIRSVA